MMSSNDAAPRIVLVDDDAAVRQALIFAFEIDGFEVETYGSGEALMGEARLPQDGCLVLDYNLPGMTGLDVLDRLRAREVTLPAIVITTNPTAELKQRVFTAGASLVEKPLLCDALTDEVWEALARAA